MKKRYGIWIDHNSAHIFTVDDTQITHAEVLASEVEPHHKGGINNEEHSTMSNQTSHDTRRNNETTKFAKQVMQKVHDGDEILIFGPSTTKTVLKREIEENKSMHKALVTVNVADTITENQMRQSVQDFFALKRG